TSGRAISAGSRLFWDQLRYVTYKYHKCADIHCEYEGWFDAGHRPSHRCRFTVSIPPCDSGDTSNDKGNDEHENKIHPHYYQPHCPESYRPDLARREAESRKANAIGTMTATITVRTDSLTARRAWLAEFYADRGDCGN